MRKSFPIITCIALVAAVSCMKDGLVEPDATSSRTVLSVGLGQTRTGISGPGEGQRKVFWTEGDLLSLNGFISEAMDPSCAGKSSAEFIWNAVISTPYRLFYPSSFCNGDGSITLPFSQNKMPGEDDIATETLPMYGYSATGGHMALNYLCSILNIKWTAGSSEGKIAYVEFSGKNGEQVCGKFSLNYETGELTGTDNSALARSVRTFSIKDLGEGGGVCNIVVPAGTYANGFKVRIVDGYGNYMDKVTASSKTFEVGEIKDMPEFEFAPTGTLDALCISTAEQLVAYARDWNAGKWESLKSNVCLLDDIVFDEQTSEAFRATKGIGSEANPINGDTNYWNGTFTGNGFKIKGLVSDCPVFAYTGGAAIIDGLVLDSSCSFTCKADGPADWGAIVGRNKGRIKDCRCDAAIAIEANSADTRNIGGIAGRCVGGGSIGSCTMGGTITLAAGIYSENPLYVGGIIGNVEKCDLSDCVMEGAIVSGDGSDFSGPSIPGKYLYAGGIAGAVTEGFIYGCCTLEEASLNIQGIFKNNIGGIVGNAGGKATIDGCVNNASIIFQSNGARANTTPTYIGGIVGASGTTSAEGAAISGCKNNGDISTKSNSTTISIGGVAGSFNGRMENCSNDGTITRTSQTTAAQANRYISVGGVIGDLLGGTVSSLDNKAEVTSNLAGTSTATTVAVGGVIGKASGDVNVNGCTNSGQVYDNGGSDVTVINFRALGGIIGAAMASIDVEDCTNDGMVYSSYNTKASRNSYCGGIIGIAGGTKADNASQWSGYGSIIIKSCTDYATIWNISWSNSYDLQTATCTGCIAGAVLGTASGRAQISGCQALNHAETSIFKTKRGMLGGITGYAGYCDISSCSVTKSSETYSTNIPRYCGGIAGQMVASSITGSSVDNIKLHGSSSAACDMGCITGTMDGNSSITNCTASNGKLSYNAVSDSFKWGAVAGTTATGAVISGCRYSGGWSVDAGATYTPFDASDVASDNNATMSDNGLLNLEYNITGTVSCSGTPLAGVVVTDGYQSVLTNGEGEYFIKANMDSASCVSISIPSGYMPEVTGGVAAFWKKLDKITPTAGVYRADFECRALSNPDKYTVIAYADVQIRPSTSSGWDYSAFHSTSVAKDVFSDIADRAAAVDDGSNLIGLSMGDQVHNDQSMYATYVGSDMLGKLGFPNFSVPGNHDYDASSSSYIQGARNFESNLGPVRYSFNMGKFHVVMLDNARTNSKGTEAKGMPTSTWQWLQSDLSHVPATTPIILCSHRPLFMETYEDRANNNSRIRDISTRSWALNTEYAALLASYKKVYAFNGDLHTIFNYVYPSGDKRNIEVHSLARSAGALWTNQFLNSCGTPRGYLVLKVDGENVTYKFKPVAYQTGSCKASPSPMTYRDYSVTDGRFYMKASYLSNPGALLDDFYQIHAYAPGASVAYPDDVIATVFMYDSRWSSVTFEYESGSKTMSQIEIKSDFLDPGNDWLFKWYKANNTDLSKDSNYTNVHPCYNCFRLTPPAGVTSGTVKVKDHFGNSYEYKLTW